MKKKRIKKKEKIAEAKGNLGVLIPGIGGAVSTTFIAGLEAVKNRIAMPIGSLTQMGTIRMSTEFLWLRILSISLSLTILSFTDGMFTETTAMMRL